MWNRHRAEHRRRYVQRDHYSCQWYRFTLHYDLYRCSIKKYPSAPQSSSTSKHSSYAGYAWGHWSWARKDQRPQKRSEMRLLHELAHATMLLYGVDVVHAWKLDRLNDAAGPVNLNFIY